MKLMIEHFFQLLHSLDEDDRSISLHTNNLNALSPRASKSTSPTTANVVCILLPKLFIQKSDNMSNITLKPSRKILKRIVIHLSCPIGLKLGTRIKWTYIFNRTARVSRSVVCSRKTTNKYT